MKELRLREMERVGPGYPEAAPEPRLVGPEVQPADVLVHPTQCFQQLIGQNQVTPIPEPIPGKAGWLTHRPIGAFPGAGGRLSVPRGLLLVESEGTPIKSGCLLLNKNQ